MAPRRLWWPCLAVLLQDPLAHLDLSTNNELTTGTSQPGLAGDLDRNSSHLLTHHPWSISEPLKQYAVRALSSGLLLFILRPHPFPCHPSPPRPGAPHTPLTLTSHTSLTHHTPWNPLSPQIPPQQRRPLWVHLKPASRDGT
ncbi:hypothetical protein CCM_03776 [Cordyceps militaris CM01]|uniref:Uncharacterized protein n=1 Tax=Cordyceps militaris (strain CM01) TaxID=983644 RepID=G3JGI6_CORMM|nr:uncharacterized protein CCM_03776 [Cordyceps militaris CM01]EGX92403.1 hypothetical protein CCM_03776 [Cordyceps militaris CM01]